jgi:hypothetical protein
MRNLSQILSWIIPSPFSVVRVPSLGSVAIWWSQFSLLITLQCTLSTGVILLLCTHLHIHLYTSTGILSPEGTLSLWKQLYVYNYYIPLGLMGWKKWSQNVFLFPVKSCHGFTHSPLENITSSTLFETAFIMSSSNLCFSMTPSTVPLLYNSTTIWQVQLSPPDWASVRRIHADVHVGVWLLPVMICRRYL